MIKVNDDEEELTDRNKEKISLLQRLAILE